MKTQYVTNDKGEKIAVILPIKAYQKLLDEAEELEDIRLYEEAKNDSLQFVDAEEAFEEVKENRLKADVSG